MDYSDIDRTIPKTTTQRVVIIGGGFAGIAAAKELARGDMQVVMIDRNNFHQFQPLLYQVATSGLEPTAISFPLRKVISKHNNFYFRMATVTGVDKDTNTLRTTIGNLTFDHLIIAAGADTNYFGMENIAKHAIPLKSVNEALAMRNHIYRILEQVLSVEDEKERESYLNFVIVGGGATGVELAGALAELKKYTLHKDYPEIDFSKMKIYLVNMTSRLLEAFSEKSSATTLKNLKNIGVEVLLNTTVNDYRDHNVICNDGSLVIPSRNLMWASGIVANKIDGIDSLGRGARIKVDEYNKVEDCENIYAVGDVAIMSQKGHPQVAQVAIQQGKNTAKNIIKISKGQQAKPFVYKDKGSMATIGRNLAVAEVWGLKYKGFVAWFLWLFIHLLFIISVRNRFTVVWNWAWSYITKDQPLRSIIESKSRIDE